MLHYIKGDIKKVKDDIIEIINDCHRFIIHTLLVAILINLINGEKSIINQTTINTLLATTLAVILYHLFIKYPITKRFEGMK